MMRDRKSAREHKLRQRCRWILCTVLLSVHAAAADKSQSGQEALQFINRVREGINIAGPNSPPFRLLAHIVAAPLEQGKPQLDGTYELAWASPDRWREEITLAGYHRVRVASQRTLWTAADLPFEPLRVYELSQLFDLRYQWTVRTGESVNLRKPKVRKGVGTQCADIKPELEPGRQVCAETPSLLPLRTEMIMPYDPVRTSFEYTEYQSSEGKQFPYAMRAFEGKSLILEARVKELVANVSLDESAFSAPPQSVSADWCSDPEPTGVIDKPGPHYPDSARACLQQGTVSVYGVVGVDGSLHDLTVVRSAGRDFDTATLGAMTRWKYRPATCAGKPVPFETVIDVSYTLRQ